MAPRGAQEVTICVCPSVCLSVLKSFLSLPFYLKFSSNQSLVSSLQAVFSLLKSVFSSPLYLKFSRDQLASSQPQPAVVFKLFSSGLKACSSESVPIKEYAHQKVCSSESKIIRDRVFHSACSTESVHIFKSIIRALQSESCSWSL